MYQIGDIEFLQNDTFREKTISLLRDNNEFLSGSGQISKENFVDQYSKESLLQEIQSKLESGKQKEAFTIAMENKLYEHALIIGSILGSQFYSQAISKFVEENLTESCSLRSIYKFCTDQVNTTGNNNSTTAAAAANPLNSSDLDQSQLAQKWKNHVSLLISSRNQNWQNAIGRIGDTLWQAQNNVIGAHFCYLLAGVKLPEGLQVNLSNSRFVLIAGDHKRSNRYVSMSSILLSEIFEYSKALSNPKHQAISLTPYKFILAAWLFDLGFTDKTKEYIKLVEGNLK